MIGGLGKHGGKYAAAERLFELRFAASNRMKKGSIRKSGGKRQGGNENVGCSGLLERRKRKTGVQDFAQQMLKRPQCLLKANGSLLAGK